MRYAYCMNCRSTIESKDIHDYSYCKCYNRNGSDEGHGIYIGGGYKGLVLGGNFDDALLLNDEYKGATDDED